MPKFYLDTEEKGKGYIVGWMGRLQKTRDGQNNRKGGSATPPVEGDDFSFTASGAVVEPSILQVQKPNDRLGDFTVVRASDASYTDSSGVIQTAPDNIARIDYTSGVAELLTEPQSTNLIEYSEDFSDASWGSTGEILTGGISSPDGGNNAYRLEQTTTDGRIRYIYEGSVIGDKLTFSTFMKKDNVDTGSIRFYVDNYGSDIKLKFNFVTKDFTITDIGLKLDNYGYKEYTDGWFKVHGSVTISTDGRVELQLDRSNTSSIGDSVYYFGATLEALPYATSYIPTNGSTVTRLQDVITDGGNVNVINSEEGVLFFEGSAILTGTNKWITAYDSSNILSKFEFLFSSSDNRCRFTYQLGDGTISFQHTEIFPIDVNNKLAFSFKQNEFKVFQNGVKLIEQLSGDTEAANTIDTIAFTFTNNTNNFFGRTRELKVYNKALPDSQLEYITTL